MRKCDLRWAALILAAGLICCAPAGAQVTFGQLDDFQNLSLNNWGQGGPSPNPSFIVNTGGPTGAGDAFLKNVSSGISGPGGRQVVLNFFGWIGNYPGAGVTRIDAEMANFGATALSMRLGIEDANGARYVSTNSNPLAADAKWHALSFGITPADLTLVRGSDTADLALSTVTAFRFNSSTNITFEGDVMASTLGLDDIHAVPEPGEIICVVVLMGVMFRRRQEAA